MTTDLELLATGLSGFAHPLRIKVLVLLEREHSPSGLTALLDGEAALGLVSYHVRMLAGYGLVEETRTAPRRGALEHFYIRTDLAEVLVDTLSELIGLPPKPIRRPGRRSADAADRRERALLVALGVAVEEEAAA